MIRRSIAILILLSSFVVGPLLARGAERSVTEGIDRYKKLVKLHPHKAAYWNALGYYYLKSGNLPEAKIFLPLGKSSDFAVLGAREVCGSTSIGTCLGLL